MKIENQVCTFEQAKTLREEGVDQKSFFAWIDEGQLLSQHSANLGLMSIATNFTAAYSVAELGLMLSNGYDSMRISTSDGDMWRGYDSSGDDYPSDGHYQTEAECRAAMIIEGIKSGDFSVDEINNRLTT